VREVLAITKKFNGGKHFDKGDVGVAAWVREIVFREFYRQVTVITPHTSMNLPQNMKFDNVEWEDDEEGWKKWYEGKTGVPFVDAGMRQLNSEAYMHNRARMNTSSYLTGNLLIDYRRGERYFAEHLIDWDLSNNTQGWEPSYTIFNPVVQAEKHDPDGDYIRKWVPELKDVKGKAIFSPHDRLSAAEFKKLNYPAPHVDFGDSSQRAKERYKKGIATSEV
jgi:deoxyribodipyrimidine photo-lyase